MIYVSTMKDFSPVHLIKKGKAKVVDNVIDSFRKEIGHAYSIFTKKRDDTQKATLRKTLSSRRLIPSPMTLDAYSIIFLQDEGISASAIPFNLHRYEILMKSSCLKGIGMPNNAGGVEFLCEETVLPVTIGSKGIISLFCNEKKRTDSVLLFWNFMDYLSYCELLQQSNHRVDNDVVIINDFRNFVDALLDCENYDYIMCFLPSGDESFEIMLATVLYRNPQHSMDMSYLYREDGFNTLSAMIKSLEKAKYQSSIR